MISIEQKIEKLEQELLELKAECGKPKKFEIKWWENSTYFLDLVVGKIISNLDGTRQSFEREGRYRKTEQGAKLSLARNKRANRLEMLVEYLGGLKEFVVHQKNFYVYNSRDEWSIGVSEYFYSAEVVYMTEGVAKQVCDILNNGEYTL